MISFSNLNIRYKYHFYIAICMLVFALTSCTKKTDELIGHYYIHASEVSGNFGNVVHLKKPNSEIGPEFSKESYMDFFSDGKYLINMAKLEYGTYRYEKDTIYLNPENAEKWKIAFKADQNLGVGHFEFPVANSRKETFKTLKKVEHKYTENFPYTLELNRWRIPADRVLSKNELIDRAQQQIRFIQTYMIWCDKEQIKMDLVSISGPIIYTRDGFRLRRIEKTGHWCDYFVEDDCDRMHGILWNHFEGLKIDWVDDSNRLIVLLEGLDELIAGLDHYRE